MRIFLFWLFFLPLFSFAELTLFDGEATLPVVVPANLSPVQKTALAELTSYLSQICGKPFNVVEEGEGLPSSAIYLGPTRYALEQQIALSKFSSEEWLIKSVGGNLILAGGEPRGTLYAVYHFLEDVLGVRWLTPELEYVPKQDKLVLGELAMRDKPQMRYRDIYLVPGAAGLAFRVRNRMNSEHAKYGGQLLFSRFPGGTGHTLYTTLGDAEHIRKLYQEHPEYFPLIAGERKLDSGKANGAAQSQLCLTNVELRKLWVEALRQHIRNDQQIAQRNGVQPPMFYAIDQNDCYDGFCTCPDCAAIVKREEGKSGLLLDFVNHVASELAAEAPQSTFQMMALHSTEKPPKQLKALANVGIRLCDTTSNMLKSWNDPENITQRANLENWAKISNDIVVWDYSINYGAPICVNYPLPSSRTYAKDLRMLAENKGGGVFFEHEQVIGADMRSLKVWLECKLAENPYLDYDLLLRDFTDHYYGREAGALIREYLALLEDAASSAKAKVTWFPSLSSFSFIDAAVMLQAAKLFDRAMESAEGSEYQQRIEHARLSLDRLYLIRAGAYRKTLQQHGQDADALPDYQQVKERYLRVWDNKMAELEPAVRNNAFIKQEYEKNVSKLLSMAEKRKELPHPAQFADIPGDALYLFGAGMAQTHINYLHLTADPDSPAGEALRAAISDVERTPHENYRQDKFTYPFKWAVWPSMKGTLRGTVQDGPKKMPTGYHWYKLGGGMQLTQSSVVALLAGFFIALDGVVSDNSELGQEYELWASIKIDGPDFFSSGTPGSENVFWVDQVAAIRQTKHADK